MPFNLYQVNQMIKEHQNKNNFFELFKCYDYKNDLELQKLLFKLLNNLNNDILKIIIDFTAPGR